MKYLIFLLLIFTFFNTYSQQKKVAIIGGGMAGIASAHEILFKHPGVEVHIFEKEAEIGGNAQTVSIENNGKRINIDAGPQYFAEGPWNRYIALLEEYGLLGEEATSNFSGTIAISENNEENLQFITPKNGKLRGQKMKELMRFMQFYKAARKVYLNKQNYHAHIGEWVDAMDIDSTFKATVIYPFLASSLGTSTEAIRQTSTKEMVKLFAFNNALKKSEFFVLNEGMGSAIQTIGKKLEKKGLIVHQNHYVSDVQLTNNKWTIRCKNLRSPYEEFDFLIIATHSDQAGNLLMNQYKQLGETLLKFPYFEARIILHRDSTFTHLENTSFFNVIINSKGSVLSNTMNLGEINPAWKGVYKSWLHADDIQRVKSNGTFIKEVLFYHPLITPESASYLVEMKKISAEIPSLYIAGGWSEGLETQETAIISGIHACEKLNEMLEH